MTMNQQTKSVVLIGETQRQYAMQLLAAVKVGQDEPTEVIFRRRLKKRTDAQRALFWIWMRTLRQHLLESTGELYSEQELHDWCCERFLGTKDVMVMGDLVRRMRGTSDLSKAEMTEFMGQLDMYCASELDLFLPATAESL
jgi:hypothetical protein